MSVEHITLDMGDRVLCDSCSRDFTDSKERGGLLFGTKAIGPCCALRWFESAKHHNETHLVRSICPDDMTFAQWVRERLR